MSGAFSNVSVSSILNECHPIENLTRAALVKAFRAVSGQFKVADTTVNNSATLAADSEFNFFVKANYKYIIEATFMFNVWAAAGPLGNLKFQLNLPAHTTNMAFEGNGVYTISGSASTILQLGSAANVPNAAPQVVSVQAFNTPIISANTATAAYSACLTLQGLLVPAIDDVLTVSLAQAAASATGSTILEKGSSMNVICLSSSRRVPNAV